MLPAISPAERAAFDEDGFLVLPGPFVTPADLAEVRHLLDPLFAQIEQFPVHVAHDLGTVRTASRSVIPEIEYVTTLVPALRRTKVINTFRALAQDYFGTPVQLTFEHAIYKPPGSQAMTPWHQDSSTDSSGRAVLTMWVPLQDTDETNGCMRYVRGSQARGPVPHQPIPDRHGRTPIEPIDEALVVLGQVPAGGVNLHREHTLHSAGPNNSSEIRRSLILQFAPRIGWVDTAMLTLARAKVARVRRQVKTARKQSD